MPAPLALTSKMAFGKQSSKGTPVTANLLCGRYVQSSLASVMEYIEAQYEHYCGTVSRPTVRKSKSRISGYTVPFGAQGFMYADSLPIFLIGAGFGVTSATGGINETTLLTTTGSPTGGTFTITYSAQTTAALPYNATAGQVAAALRALSNIGENDVFVTEGTAAGGKTWTIEWIGTLGASNITPPTCTPSFTGGTTPSITVSSPIGGVAGTNAKRHTAVIADRASAGWLTVYHSYHDGGDLFALRGTDARIEQVAIEASTRGVMLTMAGTAISEDAAAGTETFVNEADKMLLPSKGACTLQIEGEVFTSPIRGMRMIMSNPVNKGEQTLFQLTRSDLPQQGMEIGFSAMNIDIDYATYRKLKWGGAAGTAPVVTVPQGAISFNFQSAENLGTAAGDLTPFSTQINMNNVELRMGNFRAQGRDIIRFDLAGLMIDSDVNANPIQVVTNNLIASY